MSALAQLDPPTLEAASHAAAVDKERQEAMRRVAMRLEAVGQLAAGIAHEINTPVQYVNDSIHFLCRANEDLLKLVARYQAELDKLLPAGNELREQLKQAEFDADLDYIREETPQAFERVFDGISRVRNIVQAMKEFAHPDTGEKSLADLNKALRTTLTVAKNEYKYVADVKTDFAELPLVMCLLGDLNQVFLNLIVNASHAIADVVAVTGNKGTIYVTTQLDGKHVVITIADTGSGIPKALRERIFDPFFTTKEVGKGTGQGLSIARAIVVDKHGGTLSFESEVDCGTVFTIRLPVDGNDIGG